MMTVVSILDRSRSLSDAKPYPVGQVLAYEDMANPYREAVVVSEEMKSYGQRAVYRDGSAETDVSRVLVEGIGGWRFVDEVNTRSEVDELLALRERKRRSFVAERDAALEASKEREEAGKAWLAENTPPWAKAVLVAELHEDISDSMTDYYNSKTVRVVLLAWSKHKRDLFPEMRKAAAKFEPTAEMATADKNAEHREKYSMGGGYYLSTTGRYGSGWKVEKWRLDGWSNVARVAGDPEARKLLEAPDPKVSAKAGGVSSGEPLAAEVQKHFHTKRKVDFWIVVLSDRVSGERFSELRDAARDAGGWYSRKWGSTPGGFAFLVERDANQFADMFRGDEASEHPTDDSLAPVNTALVEKLRAMADGMDSQIEHLLRPLSQNWTPKRGRQLASRTHDGHDMQRAQAAVRALADANESGEVPTELRSIRTKRQFLDFTRTIADLSGGYYDYRETGEYRDKSVPALALRKLVEDRKSGSDRKRELEAVRQQEIDLEIERLRRIKIAGYFPTPEPLVNQLLDLAEIEPADQVLEPSAGTGAIADAIKSRYDVDLTCVEQLLSFVNVLGMKGHRVHSGDFLETNGELGKFDRIVMNPPFDRGADIKHVLHARGLLKPGGRLVSIVAGGPRQREALEPLADAWIDLPAESFKDAGTNVNAAIVVIGAAESE